MKKGIKILSIMAVLVVAASAMAMSDLLVYGTWRYKMTVTVETPEGIKTGSVVRELSNNASSVKLDLPEGTNAAKIKGEAVVVDLGKRGNLFVLISDKSDDEFYQVFPVPGGGPTSAAGIRYYDGLKAGTKGVLDPSRYPGYPQFVTFKDIKDPKSVEAVKADDLAATFGAGVKLKDITIEMTDEKVTEKVGDFLKWLPEIEVNKSRLNGSTSIAISTNELSDNLGSGSFRIRR